MKKVAIIVQRCHESLIGGSEALAWQYATLLAGNYAVEILTSTALDYVTWENALPEGTESRDGITVRRFAVAKPRTHYWHSLHERLRHYQHLVNDGTSVKYVPWRLALQDEFIRQQGPHCPKLTRFLLQHQDDYRAILFITYLYPTTYDGLLHFPASRALLVPTLHNELSAYLAAFKIMAHRAKSILWLTDAEKRTGERLWGKLPGRIVAMPVKTELIKPAQRSQPYLLYAGRIDSEKGCDRMVRWFLEYKQRYRSSLHFVLIGENIARIPPHPDIEYLGFVSPEEKFSLMAGAEVFVMPSPNESFSIATLEAMAQGTAALVNGECAVLADHVSLSGTGKVFIDKESFISSLCSLLEHAHNAPQIREKARDYVTSRYGIEQVRRALTGAVEDSTMS